MLLEAKDAKIADLEERIARLEPADARTRPKIRENPGSREDPVRPGTPFFPAGPDPPAKS